MSRQPPNETVFLCVDNQQKMSKNMWFAKSWASGRCYASTYTEIRAHSRLYEKCIAKYLPHLSRISERNRMGWYQVFRPDLTAAARHSTIAPARASSVSRPSSGDAHAYICACVYLDVNVSVWQPSSI